MELGLRKMMVVLMMVIVTVEVVSASLVYVGGGKETWRANVNFSEWSARQQNVYVGDWLYFGFDKKQYNVLEVNKTSYESCNEVGFIKNITRGGRDVFQVKEAKTYYFINGGGYCFGGMKVAIHVKHIGQHAPPPSPTPAAKSHKNDSPSNFNGHVVITVSLLMVVLTNVFLYWAIL